MNNKVSILVSLLLCCILPINTHAQTFTSVSPSGHTLYYWISSQGHAVLDHQNTLSLYGNIPAYDDLTGNLIIPDTVVNNNVAYQVKEIAYNAFYRCSGLTTVEIPSTVTVIASSAFRHCSNITSVNIPPRIKRIMPSTFEGCTRLASIIIPDSVTYIGNEAFGSCDSLASIILGNHVDTIEGWTFSGGNSVLTSLTLPRSLKYLGEMAFNCSGLRSLTVESENLELETHGVPITSEMFFAPFGGNMIDTITIGKHVKHIPDGLFWGAMWYLRVLNYYADSCTHLGEHLAGTSQYPFFDANATLQVLNIGNSVKYIPDYAFNGLYAINTPIVLSDSIKYIGNSAFRNCNGLSNASIPQEIRYIGDFAFSGTDIQNVIVPPSMTSLGNSVFSGCNRLSSVVLPSTITSIGTGTFSNCNSLESIQLPDSLSSISASLFSGCSVLTEIHFPSNITSVGASSFSNCTGLTQLYIDSTIATIGDRAFWGCANIDTIEINRRIPPTIDGHTFDGISTNTPVYVPCGSSRLYSGSLYWNVFDNYMEVDSCFRNIIAISNNSSMGIVTGGGRYNLGSDVVISAIPFGGYGFVSWSDDNNSNPRTITVDNDTTITALFQIISIEPDTIIAYDTI